MSTPGNSPSKNQQDHIEYKEKERENVTAFFSKLEMGDLCFMDIMEYGLALFGETKAGKTTLAHHLIQNSLMGTEDNNYDARNVSRFKEAIIGHKPVSQTEIPNQITKKVKGTKPEEKEVQMHILDCPGYSDSKGCFMVIANGYFHYRIFSKVKNLKFAIILDNKQFSGVFSKPKNTLIEFLMSFNNLKDIKEQIFSATTIVFTKLLRNGQSNEEINNNIENKLNALRNSSIREFESQIKELIDAVIANKRYFFFEHAVEGIPARTDNKILQEIHDSTRFWERNVVEEEKEVDMTHIAMTLGERTRELAETNSKFKHDLSILTAQFKHRFERALLSLYNKPIYNPECSLQRIIVEFLNNSILGTQKSCSFYTDYIQEFIKVFNIYKTNPINSKVEYEEKRKKIKEKIAKTKFCESIDHSFVQSIQKLEICKLILEIVRDKKYILGDDLGDRRSLSAFKNLSNEVLGILSQFRKIRFFNNQYEKATYANRLDDFTYIVYRLLEEAKTFKIIFSTALEKKHQFQTNMFVVQSLDVTQVLYDFIQSISDEDYEYLSLRDNDVFEKCQLTYLVNHLELLPNQQDSYYSEIEKYFSAVKFEKTKFEKQAGKKLKDLGMVKLNSSKFNADKKERVVTFISVCKNIINSFENGDYVGEEYEQRVEEYLEAINKLAKELLTTNQEGKDEAKRSLRFAIRLFDSISNVHRVIESYRCLVTKSEGIDLKNALVEFADYAARHGRIELAIEVYQHAYSAINEAYDSDKGSSLAIKKQEREAIAAKIGMVGVERKHNPSMTYFDSMLRKKFFEFIDPQLLTEIGTIYRPEEKKEEDQKEEKKKVKKLGKL